ncbi:ABC transporter ATP-binding protein [Clostridium sp. NSJ-6]|uniref:ABC transporter ATP-binding protein n=1 Tax=Clostridium hominis TaxID=2763036 RepID=A0ABR7D8Z9_9CLOT|nr:ABC transporter ATP-binding protein [Clostridium hominis]MBC5627687.1 ABC transporter ATP-binding protein [Clostridium hominis]MDU2673055.1 ABC transporter ATP-binding protein [Clostridium sp.]
MTKYILRYKGWLATTVLFRAFGAIMQVLIALIIQQIVDTAMNKDVNGFIDMIIFSIIFFMIMGINDYLNKTTQFIYIKKTLTDFKEDIFRGILRKNYKDFNSENTAEYISQLTNDINMVETKYLVPYLEMIGDVVIFVGTTALLLWINPWVTLVVCATSALLFLIPAILGAPTAKRQDDVSKQNSIFTTRIKDIFSGYEVIKSYNIVDNMTEEFLDENSTVENLKFKSNHIQGISQALSMFLGVMSQISTIALGGYFLIKGQLTVGTLFAVVQLANGICWPITWIVSKVTLVKGMKEVNFKLLSIINESKKKIDTVKLESFKKEIELKDITFAYNEDRNALDGLSVSFEKDKKYAIVGRSGSGKSTLLKLLLGYYDDFDGEIALDGYNYDKLDKNSINNHMSIIHQNVYMFDKTLKENIILGKDFNDKVLEKALENSGVSEFLRVLPKGVDSEIGENGNNLSGGQKQRVAIARSLIQNTPILLLDEGTSALDSKTAFEIEDTLLNIEDLTVITVTHKLIDSILKRYDEIIVMDNGNVVEKGSFDELINNKKEFYDLYTIEGESELVS